MLNNSDIVLGTFFGDEGKGNIVQWRCLQAIGENLSPIVCRFSSGPQASHNIVHNDISHICSSFGAGTLVGVPTYLDENVLIDPICILNEYNELIKKGIKPTLYVNEKCKIITPFDVLSNINDENTLNNGSCGKGIFSTYKRYNNTNKVTYLGVLPYQIYIKNVCQYYYGTKLCASKMAEYEEYVNMFNNACKWLTTCSDIHIVSDFNNILINFDNKINKIIFEGSQGLLLDMERGFMPHCTPSKVGLTGFETPWLQKCLTNANVYLTMRCYLTRHGNGYEPLYTQYLNNYFTDLSEPTNNDTGYQGLFKRGVFDMGLLTQTIGRHTLDNYKYIYNCKFIPVITKMDTLKDTIIIPYIPIRFKSPSNASVTEFCYAIKTIFLQTNLLNNLDNFEVYLSYSNDSSLINKM